MYYQPLLTEKEKAIQQEVRKFVCEEVSHDFIRALDRDEIKYPREYVEKLAARGQDAEDEKCYTDEDMWRVHQG